MAALRNQALSLYRRLLRAAKGTWQGGQEEADYIRQEARQQFQANRHNTNAEEVAKALEEGERRLEIALHYGIAYPRLWHADQFEKVPYVQAPKIGEELDPEAVASGIKDRGIAEKLAAAARRRRERQAQQKGAAGEGIP